MEPSTRKALIIGGLALATGVGVTLVATRANAAKTLKGEPFVLQFMRTTGYRTLPVVTRNIPMVDPDPSSKGPRLIEWARAEQAKGKEILVPSVYYQGMTAVHPSQFMAVDPVAAKGLTVLGIFKILPKI